MKTELEQILPPPIQPPFCVLTSKRDVEAALLSRVVRLKFQPGNMATAGQGRGQLTSGERPQDRWFSRPAIFDSQEVKLRLHVKIIKCQVDPTFGFCDDQPNTVQAAPIFLWVVWGENNSRWGGEVEEAGNCNEKSKQQILVRGLKLLSWFTLSVCQMPRLGGWKEIHNLLAGEEVKKEGEAGGEEKKWNKQA